MARYKIAVITAFHNTDFELFERADVSMRNQTIGFKSVQWIIVMHNCDKEYIDKVSSMYKNDRNVKVVLLNNDKQTPGSPRNEAFKYVESKYITFLDSDDSYSVDCLGKIVYEMDNTGADVLRYRMEAILLQKGGLQVNILCDANATYERIICEKGDWNLNAMFSGYYGCCATQVYRFDFIKEKKLLFDEDQPVAEDILFNTMALVRAERVCILPQYIGYQYYQNANSTCRIDDRTDDEIVAMARGIKNIFDEMKYNGADVIFYCYGLIAIILCAKILRSKLVTEVGRKKVKEILGEYVINMPILPDNKYYDKATVYELYNRARHTVLFPERPMKEILKDKLNGASALLSILTDNADTDYGRRYHFNTFKNIHSYMNRVPLSDEKTYKPLIDLIYRVDEKDIILKKEVNGYILNDEEELFPITDDFIYDMVGLAIKDMTNHDNFFIGRCYIIKKNHVDNKYVHSLESMMFKNYASYKIFTFNNEMVKNTTGPSHLYRYVGDESVYDNLLMDALDDMGVDQIIAFNAKIIYEAFAKFELNYNDYIDKSKCSPERKSELKKICESGFEGIAKKIWPKLERVIAFGCGKYKDSYEKLQKYIKGVAYNHGSYFTEKGVLGVAVSDDSDIFEVYKEKYFLELLEKSSKDDKTVVLTEASVDKIYEIIMTNGNGLYRYKTKVFIKPVEVSETTFKYKFV